MFIVDQAQIGLSSQWNWQDKNGNHEKETGGFFHGSGEIKEERHLIVRYPPLNPRPAAGARVSDGHFHRICF